jgi:hypothetical protein
MISPFFRVWTNFLLKSPRIRRLSIKVPICLGHSFGSHQPSGGKILYCLLAFAFPNPIANPGCVHARIDYEVGNVDVFGTQLPRRSLRHRTKTKLGAGECCVSDTTA